MHCTWLSPEPSDVWEKGSNILDFILVLVVVFSFALVHFLQFLSIFTFVKVYASV